VMPVYNEREVLWRLVRSVDAAIVGSGYRHEIVFVNDGSQDGSRDLLDQIAETHPHVRVIHFSRNFGHQPAVHAGLTYARGDAVVVMDSDLQDSPTALPEFLACWEQGYQVVYAVRTRRKEAVWKKFLFFAFYRVLNSLVTTELPADAGNFGLMDRVVVDEILKIPDCDRYFPGLRNWVGFRQTGIPVERLARHDDHPRVTLRQLFSLAKAAIFGFSRAPLSMFYGIAILSFALFLVCSVYTLYHRFVTHLAIPGWTSVTMVSALFGALNALGISVLGEYVVRIYDQVRQRPSFVVARTTNFSERERCSRQVDLLTEVALHEDVTQLSHEVQTVLRDSVANSQHQLRVVSEP
ncbi:MAG: glycosyltransferase family 2 protein, partial [Planctomycetota bacterium]|nr:glycosyltransferase family 2 protein [Planctomycetota bacterium]